MKMSIKTFACVFAALIIASCNNVGEPNPQVGPGDNLGNVACKSYDIDTDPVCKSEDRIYVEVIDEQEIEFEVNGVYYNSKGGYNNVEKCAEGIYLNGEYVSMDEVERRTNDDGGWEFKEAIRDEYLAYYERRGKCVELIWDLLKEARDIAVPCQKSVQYIHGRWWAMLTEEEIAELEEKHDNISIVPIIAIPEDDTPVGGNGVDSCLP
jgi:hypothetical protein